MDKCFKHIENKKASLIYVSSIDENRVLTVGIHFYHDYDDKLEGIFIRKLTAKVKDIESIKTWKEVDFQLFAKLVLHLDGLSKDKYEVYQYPILKELYEELNGKKEVALSLST